MDELMRDHGGFEHNRQTLRILEVLEERYAEFPGLNLTWEVREGMIKHQPASDATAPAEYAPGEAPDPRGAARRLRGRDRLQQPRHRRRPDLGHDDASSRCARSASSARPTTATLARGVRGRAARAARDDPADHRPLQPRPDRDDAGRAEAARASTSVEDVRQRRPPTRRPTRRRHGGAGAGAEGVPAQEHVPHYRVVRMGDKAGRILRDLFQSYTEEPLQLPPRYQARIEKRRPAPRGLRLHRRHDRPLRAGRAPQAVRSAGAVCKDAWKACGFVVGGVWTGCGGLWTRPVEGSAEDLWIGCGRPAQRL